MERSLGLDIGANSIGWAVIEQNGTGGAILGVGVYTFPEGVENFGEGDREISRNATRRAARQRRRQLFRRKLRKRALLKLMATHGLCPALSEDELRQWHKSGQFPERTEVQQWIKLNPYHLRLRATQERVTLYELGRIFYHLAQRRGFPTSSRRAQQDERSTIEKGDVKAGKPGIEQTRALLDHAPTLGSALATLYPPEGQPYRNNTSRIRNRYTDRQMYVAEFEFLWEKQRQFYPYILTDDLKAQLGGRRKDGYSIDGVLFLQRPLRSQKHLLGRCTFEPSKPRCLRSHPLFERFRALQFINSILCNDLPLDADDRSRVLRLMLTKKNLKFTDIRKAIGKLSAEYIFNYADDDSIVGSPTNAALASKNIFGKAWFDKSDHEQHQIWHVLQSFDDRDKLIHHATTKLGMSDTAAKHFASVQLTDGYASLSLKAIRAILPFLEQGYPYHLAVALAGTRRALGPRWDQLDEEQRTALCDTIEGLVGSGVRGGYLDKLKEMLRTKFKLSDKELSKLYHHSQFRAANQLLNRIPTDAVYTSQLLALRNPAVTNVLFATRRLVNELLSRFGHFDRIVIELARDLKRTKSQRAQIRKEQQRREIINRTISAILEKEGIRPTAENILKYRLWLECNKTCPYSNRSISFHQLYNGEVQVEHIFPYDRSLDDSYLNKTLCFADINRKKGNRTPYEFFTNDFGMDRWEEVKQRLRQTFTNQRSWQKDSPLDYFPERRKKYERFIAEKLPSDFVGRQLNDTRHASIRAVEMLQLVCPIVSASAGTATAKLRNLWGLDRVLGDLESDTKSRNDHRHHALDAIVLACTRPAHIQQLATANARKYSKEPQLEPPWSSFRFDVEDAMQRCIVVHHRTNRVITRLNVTTTVGGTVLRYRSLAARGPLHRETFYGKHLDPSDGQVYYHVRKPLAQITKRAQVEKIVDRAIRELVEARIKELGSYGSNDDVPKGAFFGTNPDGSPQPLLFLPNRRGEPVPILNVRLRESLANARPVHPNQNRYVDPSNNHHAIIYRLPDGTLEISVVQFWDAVLRCRLRQPLYQVPPNCELVMTLHINDIVLLGCPDKVLEEVFQTLTPDQRCKSLWPYLHKVQKLSQSSPKSWELCFRHIADARPSEEAKKDYILIRNWGTGKQGWFTYNPIKLRVTPSGLIYRWGELPHH